MNCNNFESGRKAAFGILIPKQMIRFAVFYDGSRNLYGISSECIIESLHEQSSDSSFLEFGGEYVRIKRFKTGIDNFTVLFTAKPGKEEAVAFSNRDGFTPKKCGFTVSFSDNFLTFSMGDGVSEYEWKFPFKEGISDVCLKVMKRKNRVEAIIDGVKTEPVFAPEIDEEQLFTLDSLDLCIGADPFGAYANSGGLSDFYLLRGIADDGIIANFNAR
ncbi:MAG: hypothetical protein PUE85_08175 [Firmicutes bacterium]|nr:hypothetical protein [Bacillota bacterium]